MEVVVAEIEERFFCHGRVPHFVVCRALLHPQLDGGSPRTMFASGRVMLFSAYS
jgi:hypothetical protein